MAVNLVYKGDLAEVSLAKETGLVGQGTNVTSGGGTTAGWNTADGSTANTSSINLGNGLYWVNGTPKMMIPDGMLVGATLRIHSTGGSNRYTADDYASTKRTYYVTANSGNTITIQPRLATTGAVIAHTGDHFIINFSRVPTFDSDMTPSTDERVKADQFLGLLNSFTLPEPEIDVRKQHIVGMGRDVNVLTSGKETLAGGAYDLMAHNLRMWKYALGGHSAKSKGEYANVAAADTVVGACPLNFKTTSVTSQALAAQEFGTDTTDVSITVTNGTTVTGLGSTVGSDVLLGNLTETDTGTDITIAAGGKNFNESYDLAEAAGLFKVLDTNGAPLLGSYTSGAAGTKALGGCADIDSGALARAQTANKTLYLIASPNTSIEEGDLRINLGAATAAKFTIGDYIQIYDKDTVQVPGADTVPPTINKHEIRRVIAIGTSDGNDAAYVYVEEPLLFAHTAGSWGVERLQYTWDSANSIPWERGSPAILSTGELKYGVEHTFFGGSYLPTFSLEQSFRQTDVTPGAEQMLRVFSGCKVGSMTMTADSEGELKISGDYEATKMFHDTANTFITPHRMFENTANSQIKRRVSGIAVNGEKPYLFQHMIFSAFGSNILRAKNVEMSINNANTAQWYIRGTDGAYADADQVQEGATQYASEITEAAREYTFKFTALVEDTRWFDQLRTRKHHINSNDCTLILNKPGSATTRQNATITLEDYTITKAEHPLPDDKGPVTANVEFAVRHLKVVETNPYFIL